MTQIALDLWDDAQDVRDAILLGQRARIRRNTLNGLRNLIAGVRYVPRFYVHEGTWWIER